MLTEVVGEMSVWQIGWLILWAMSHILHRLAGWVANFFEQRFLNAMVEGGAPGRGENRARQLVAANIQDTENRVPERGEEPAHSPVVVGAREAADVDWDEELLPGSYLLPTDPIVVDDDLPHMRDQWGPHMIAW